MYPLRDEKEYQNIRVLLFIAQCLFIAEGEDDPNCEEFIYGRDARRVLIHGYSIHEPRRESESILNVFSPL